MNFANLFIFREIPKLINNLNLDNPNQQNAHSSIIVGEIDLCRLRR